jgi:hypothetical protein
MSFGLAAFKSEAAAGETAEKLEGRVIRWDQVLSEAQP